MKADKKNVTEKGVELAIVMFARPSWQPGSRT
jgi:hypothetical protein